MKLGFLTWCFPSLTLDEVLAWAMRGGFECVGLDRWPWDVGQAKELLARYPLHVTSLGTAVNILDPDESARRANVRLVEKVIVHAEKLDVEIVDIFAGRDPNKPVEANYPAFREVMRSLVKFAADHGRKIAVENCPMMHDAWPGGTNIAYSPRIWEHMFDMVPAGNFGLTLDPAHFVWLHIDCIAAIGKFGKRIFGIHAKDCEILEDELAVAGILSDNWWRYRMPGFGEVDWPAFFSSLAAAGFSGDVNLEHEDPLFGFDDLAGSVDKVKQGLLVGRDNVGQYLTRVEHPE